MNRARLRGFSTLLDFTQKKPNPTPSTNTGIMGRSWNPLPIPHRTIPEPKGQDLDFVNVAHSHLINTDWTKLNAISTGLTPFRIKHVLLKIKKDPVLSLEFFEWIQKQNPTAQSLETHCIILHILTNTNRFRAAESILKSNVIPKYLGSSLEVFEAILYSYRLCHSSPRVFDSLFKTYAHMKKFRNATEVFCRMKDYGFLPKVESCNAYMSSLLNLNRTDIALTFYREMRRCRISPNSYTLNMVISALCKSGKLDKAIEVFKEMESMGCSPTLASYNTLIAGHCNLGLTSSAVKLKNTMEKSGSQPNVVTYNTLMHGFCKEGKLNDANRVFNEMKAAEVIPNTITYNTLINGYSQVGNSEMGGRIYEEMLSHGIKADILTYNALILGLCKEGKTKRAAHMVKELDKENLVPNSSTFSALIMGQCVRQNSERAFHLYRSMKKNGCHPNGDTFKMLISTFCKNEDFDATVRILIEMLERCIIPESSLLVELCEGLSRRREVKLATKLYKELEGRHLLRLLPVGFEKEICVEVKVEIEEDEEIYVSCNLVDQLFLFII